MGFSTPRPGLDMARTLLAEVKGEILEEHSFRETMAQIQECAENVKEGVIPIPSDLRIKMVDPIEEILLSVIGENDHGVVRLETNQKRGVVLSQRSKIEMEINSAISPLLGPNQAVGGYLVRDNQDNFVLWVRVSEIKSLTAKGLSHGTSHIINL